MLLAELSRVNLPDWGWHLEDREESAKLMASLVQHGQLAPLLVRSLEPGYFEIIDGRRRLHIMRQLGCPSVWITDKGGISRSDAIRVAMSLELSASVDYAKMAGLVKHLSTEEGFTSLAMTTPFTADRLDYFVQLTDFDWSQFSGIGEQVALFEDDDSPVASKPVTLIPGVPGVRLVVDKPVVVRLPPVSVENEEARRLTRGWFDTSPIASTSPLADTSFMDSEATAPDVVQEISFESEDLQPAEIADWVPSEPPCLDGIDELELDTETTGLKWWAGDLPIGISLRLPDGRKCYLPWGHRGGNLDEATVKRWAQRELRHKRITNAATKFDNHMLHAWGVDLEEQGCILSDVQHYAALLDEYRQDFHLDTLGKDFLGQEKIKGLDKTRMKDYHASQVAAYAEQDVHLVHELKQVMWPLMEAEGLHKVRQIEDDVIFAVCEMERNGAHVDRAKLQEWVIESGRMLSEMLYRVGQEAGFGVNPDKNADLVRLFEFLQLEVPGYTEPTTKFPKGQPSFADVLLAKVDHPLVQTVRRSGKLASLRSKFLLGYEKVVGDDNKLRFALHQLRGDDYGTVRGRFSMSGASRGIGQFGANLQQVFRVNSQREAFGFKHDDSSHDHEIFLVRSLFVPERGTYLSADAQSIEYRLATHYSGSEKLIEAYQADAAKLERGELTGKWVDFHGVVGGFVKPYKDLSRNIIKNLNFCKIYGGGRDTVARTLGLERKESDQIVDIYDRTFPEFAKLLKGTSSLAEKRGFVKTIAGRRARFPDKSYCHAALNYVIQGSAADIMKVKLVELHKARKVTGFVMRQTVHDEVDGDSLTPETPDLVRAILNRQSFPLKVPIVWEVETGVNWAEAH